MEFSTSTSVAGWVFSAVISIIFIIGAYMQFTFDASAEANASAAAFPQWLHTATAIWLVVAVCLHLIPQVSFSTLGAIIMTGMLGGMIATLMIEGNSLWWTRGLMALLPWLGLYLRFADFNDLMSFWRHI